MPVPNNNAAIYHDDTFMLVIIQPFEVLRDRLILCHFLAQTKAFFSSKFLPRVDLGVAAAFLMHYQCTCLPHTPVCSSCLKRTVSFWGKCNCFADKKILICLPRPREPVRGIEDESLDFARVKMDTTSMNRWELGWASIFGHFVHDWFQSQGLRSKIRSIYICLFAMATMTCFYGHCGFPLIWEFCNFEPIENVWRRTGWLCEVHYNNPESVNSLHLQKNKK